MNYLEAYFSRLNHFGNTTGERITNGGIRTFQRWKNESPHTVLSLSVERGLYFDGIILQSKDKAFQKILHLNVSNDIPIQVGDILNWPLDDGSIEKWILLSEEKKVNGTYRTFDILRCNYLIKWINDKGYLKQSWAYVLSSTDEKIKGNFRTWHNLITPQPNKYAEIIMPRPIDDGSEIANTVNRGTNFIIEDESWKMVEADFTSVKGIIYMSLTENKVNLQYDYLGEGTDDVADLDKYKFPNLPTLYKVGDTIVPQFEEGTLNQWEIILQKPDDCDFINDNFVATGAGQCIITMTLKDIPAVSKQVEIIINEPDTEPVYYIAGPDKLRLDRRASYYLLKEGQEDPLNGQYGANAIEGVEMEIQSSSSQYNTLIDTRTPEQIAQNELPKIYMLHANDKNELGDLVLVATYQGTQYTKTVQIIPLW